jgi:hypothetical protein
LLIKFARKEHKIPLGCIRDGTKLKFQENFQKGEVIILAVLMKDFFMFLEDKI